MKYTCWVLDIKHAEMEPSVVPFRGVQHKLVPIYSYVRENGGTHWRYWSVTDDETALLISYTCDAAESGREAVDVDEMVRSVRLYHSAPVH